MDCDFNETMGCYMNVTGYAGEENILTCEETYAKAYAYLENPECPPEIVYTDCRQEAEEMGLVGLPYCRRTVMMDCNYDELSCEMTVTGYAGQTNTMTCEETYEKAFAYLAAQEA